jgi:hypothetical protein
MFKEEDTPKNYELWVESVAHGRYLARKLTEAYISDKDRAVNALDKHLHAKNSYTYRISGS